MISNYEDAAQCIAGYEPLEDDTSNRQTISIGLSFSLFLRTEEGLGITGDAHMSKTATNVPLRASKSVHLTNVQEYDDDSVARMPRSAIRYRSNELQNERTTQALPRVSHRVSGSTRLGLIAVLVFCVLFLLNGLIWPMFSGVLEQFKYGDSRIATYDLASKHWITEEENGRVRIVVSNEDGTHNQVLTTMISNAPKHALVSLSVDNAKIDVSINGAFVTTLVSDGNNGYKWSTN